MVAEREPIKPLISSGKALFATTISGSTEASEYNALAVDGNGNVFAAADVLWSGDGRCGFSDGLDLTSTLRTRSGLLVKYNSARLAQWAQSLSGAEDNCAFFSLALDGKGGAYVSGDAGGVGQLDFGNGVTVDGFGWANLRLLLVKYDSTGKAQWAKLPGALLGSPTARYPVATSETGVEIAGPAWVGDEEDNDEIAAFTYDFNGREKQRTRFLLYWNVLTVWDLHYDRKGYIVLAGGVVPDMGSEDACSPNSVYSLFVAKYPE